MRGKLGLPRSIPRRNTVLKSGLRRGYFLRRAPKVLSARLRAGFILLEIINLWYFRDCQGKVVW